MIEYIIEINDKSNQTYKISSTNFLINNLKSFTKYTFRVYAVNQLGSSPKSEPLTIQTLESGKKKKIKFRKEIFFFLSSIDDGNRSNWNISE